MRLAWGVATALALGCGSGSGGSGGGPEDVFDNPKDVEPDDPSIAPAAPLMTPCPSGWVELPGEVPTCAPWQPNEGADPPAEWEAPLWPWIGSGMLACAADEVHLPGKSACEPIGDPCPAAGDFADNLPAGSPVIYVREGGTGDGSLADPYGDLQVAIDAAPTGAVLALSGTLDGTELTIGRSITLWGSCTTGTTLTSPVLVTGLDADVVAGNLTARGFDVRAGASLHLSKSRELTSAIFASLKTTLITAEGSGSSVILDHVRFELSRIYEELGFEGVFAPPVYTVRVSNGATATISNSSLLGGTLGAIGASEGALVTVESSALSRSYTLVERPGTYCPAAPTEETDACTTDLDLDLRDFCGRPVECADTDNSATLYASGGAVIRADAVAVRGYYLNALADGDGSRIEISRSHVGRSTELADCAGDPSEGAQDRGRGFAGMARDGATIDFAATTVDGSAGTAIASRDATLSLQDVIVRGTASRLELGTHGRGVEIQGGSASLARVMISDNQDVGLHVSDGASVTATDVALSDTREQTCAIDKNGCPSCTWDATSSIVVSEDAVVDLTRFTLSSSALIGVQQSSGGLLYLHDGTVRDNPIATNIQDADYDLKTLQDNVLWLDNTVSLDAEQLPVPEPQQDLDTL